MPLVLHSQWDAWYMSQMPIVAHRDSFLGQCLLTHYIAVCCPHPSEEPRERNVEKFHGFSRSLRPAALLHCPSSPDMLLSSPAMPLVAALPVPHSDYMACSGLGVISSVGCWPTRVPALLSSSLELDGSWFASEGLQPAEQGHPIRRGWSRISWGFMSWRGVLLFHLPSSQYCWVQNYPQALGDSG